MPFAPACGALSFPFVGRELGAAPAPAIDDLTDRRRKEEDDEEEEEENEKEGQEEEDEGPWAMAGLSPPS